MSYDFNAPLTINFSKYTEFSALVFWRGVINSHLSTCRVLYSESEKIPLKFLTDFIEDKNLRISINNYIKNPSTTNARITSEELDNVLKIKNFSDIIQNMQNI